MASEIDICNLALSRVGAPSRISALTDPSKEARLCRMMLPFARGATLEVHDWSFARKRLALAVIDADFEGWDFAYQRPGDCVAPRYIFNPASDLVADRIPFETAADSTLARNVILTDAEDAVLIYTALVTDPNMYTPMFSDALAWRLASDLAFQLRGKVDLQQKCIQLFFSSSRAAAASNANADGMEQGLVDYVRARG